MKFRLTLLMTGLVLANAAMAATEINLRHQPASYMQNQMNSHAGQVKFKVIRTDVDFNQTAHTRLQEMYGDIPVWHATSVMHTPKAGSQLKRNMLAPIQDNTTMNGVVYEGLDKDLVNSPAASLSNASAQQAIQAAKMHYTKQNRAASLSAAKDEKAVRIIFIDDNKKAHYAYLTSFNVMTASSASRPTAIVDVTTQQVYKSWEGLYFSDAKTEAAINAAREKMKRVITGEESNTNGEIYAIKAGGIGGNIKAGETVYDGGNGHAPALDVMAMDLDIEIIPGSNTKVTLCAVANESIMVVDASTWSLAADLCVPNLAGHNNVAWLSVDKGMTRWNNDEMNDGYSPSLDAFNAATLVKGLYKDWYNTEALVDEDGNPMQYIMRVHFGRKFDNAFWDGEMMTFGDGGRMFYPLTSVGVTAHEISHGFTQTHSGIDGEQPQMAALHESFSDMAAVTVQNYQTGSNTWDVGREIMKNEGALRYLDNPTKDGTSIDNLKDFDATEPHAGAGITNKAFYLLATTKGWTTRKAFDVWVKANMNYWTSSMVTFNEAACGVLSATKDYGYNLADVRVAFAKVGIDTDTCEAASAK